MAHTNKAHNLEQLADKQARAQELAKKLAASMRIEDIWPDAFRGDAGTTCCVRYHQKMAPHPSTDMVKFDFHLYRSDGVVYPLTIEQYAYIKGE